MPSVVARCTATATLATALLAAVSLSAQPRPATVPVAATPIITKSFGDLGAGPYKALVIRNAMVIPGHGGPPAGPYDIKVEGNLITEMVPFDPVTAERAGARPRMTGDRIIDAGGKFVMPGMIDLHTHIRTLPMEIEYVYYLKLAMGVTTMVNAADRGYADGMREARRSAANEMIAPRMYPLVSYGAGTTFSRLQLDDPSMAPQVVKAMAANGVRVISMDPLGWNLELVGAIAKAAKANGMITSFHLQPANTAVTQAVKAACAGVTMIEHHYGYAESSLDGATQDFPRNYEYGNENDRFREAGRVWTYANRERLLGAVVDSLVRCGVTMLPTRVVYEANRDLIRAMSLPWTEKYTHQALWNWNLPNPAFHGAYHYDWTSDDEYNWTAAYRLWGDLIFEFNRRGGTVAFGTDDNYIWATPGFSTVRELQLGRETGMKTLEVLKSATYTSARTLGEPKLGLVRPGYTADLLIVDGNPAANLKYLYAFGDLALDRSGAMMRTKGIVHTIKDGIVLENANLMREVERMVQASRTLAPAADPVRDLFKPSGK
ncbi:MAG: amidohydrolase family protein [Gemmatimonas sp.]|uniref:amidohydrolase family protein n=1 Tax=Gemmatimonas sp. TaxID=1962908 RepID=UPI0025BA6B2F|nr:amidohydrolase family protein [Gemmatimonas sp.]MCA2986704.1 amidohydrolase family protein [Gemmatimonas sp.]